MQLLQFGLDSMYEVDTATGPPILCTLDARYALFELMSCTGKFLVKAATSSRFERESVWWRSKICFVPATSIVDTEKVKQCHIYSRDRRHQP